jgi:hypothetical protein
MSQPLPAPRQVPVVPRLRHGELSASYLARIARANWTDWRDFAGLLGRLPGGLPRNPSHLAFTVVTTNEAAFARLLAYTGHDPNRLIRAVPSLAPITFVEPGEPPALRGTSLHVHMLDCPQCRLRRDGAFLDTRLFPLKMACVHHGYWLYRDGSGRLLPPAILPEIAAAQRRLKHLAARRGADAAVRAYELARRYFEYEWSASAQPHWYTSLAERWYQRAEAAPSAQRTSWLPSWARHPECVALATIFASPYWAELAIPTPERTHRRFYQHLLAVLSLNDEDDIPSIRNFDPLPDAIREQASRGRLLSDPGWDSPIASDENPRMIPFIDITDDRERSVA